WILHDWGDKECLKLLRNCYEAISECGKVIVVESVLPELPTPNIVTATTLSFDVGMLHLLPGGKERTFKEFETLFVQVGFSAFKPICRVYNYWVIELLKNKEGMKPVKKKIEQDSNKFNYKIKCVSR
ncbi:hypothetical protein Gotri_001487, partial [Gossypium trilobum]|nr:hypothetical protein [Gossypium trilobum]